MLQATDAPQEADAPRGAEARPRNGPHREAEVLSLPVSWIQNLKVVTHEAEVEAEEELRLEKRVLLILILILILHREVPAVAEKAASSRLHQVLQLPASWMRVLKTAAREAAAAAEEEEAPQTGNQGILVVAEESTFLCLPCSVVVGAMVAAVALRSL